jgi:hypothetical protein
MAKRTVQTDDLLDKVERDELTKLEKEILFTEGTNAGKIKPNVARDVVDRYMYLKDKEAGKLVAAPVNEGIARDVVRLEREFRRYVKSGGGLVKGLSEDQIRRAEEIKLALNRAEWQWYTTIIIAGMNSGGGLPTVPAEKPAADFIKAGELSSLLVTLRAGLKAEIKAELAEEFAEQLKALKK